jgi:branched-chain amino acid transport system substrate-binding protein
MVTRRTFVKGVAASSLIPGSSGWTVSARAKGSAMKIGYVSPRSGPLAAFAEADAYVLDGFKAAAKAQGLNIEVIVKDSQSNPNRAAIKISPMISRHRSTPSRRRNARS